MNTFDTCLCSLMPTLWYFCLSKVNGNELFLEYYFHTVVNSASKKDELKYHVKDTARTSVLCESAHQLQKLS